MEGNKYITWAHTIDKNTIWQIFHVTSKQNEMVNLFMVMKNYKYINEKPGP